jgi:hypothetical protein
LTHHRRASVAGIERVRRAVVLQAQYAHLGGEGGDGLEQPALVEVPAGDRPPTSTASGTERDHSTPQDHRPGLS